MNYITEIEKLVPIPEALKGAADADGNYDYEPMRQIIEDAGMDVIRNVQHLYPQDLNLFTRKGYILQGDKNGIDLPTGIVEYVENNGKTCMEIPPGMKNVAKDTTSLSYASAEYPVFYKENKRLYVLPMPPNDISTYSIIFSQGTNMVDNWGNDSGIPTTFIQFSTSASGFNAAYMDTIMDLPAHFSNHTTGKFRINQGNVGGFSALQDIDLYYVKVNDTTLALTLPFFVINPMNLTAFENPVTVTEDGVTTVYYKVSDGNLFPVYSTTIAYLVDQASTTVFNPVEYNFTGGVTNDASQELDGATVGIDEDGNIVVDATRIVFADTAASED